MISEKPTEEECYLYALTQDESGLDLAEFCMMDTRNESLCFRAWPFQYGWWRTNRPKTIDAGSRSCGKSLSIQLRAFAHPFNHPQEEMVITAPEANHLDAVTDNVESIFTSCKLASEMVVGGRSGIKHRPFLVNFANNSKIMGRIPHNDGKNVKGIHPILLEMDEASDYPSAGWTELNSTLQENPKSRWRAHGVTRGVGDVFDEKITGKDSTWHITRLPAMYRPNWTEDERARKIEEYNGYDSPGYQRNVLGKPGDGNSPMFVLSRIMGCTVIDLNDPYNLSEYYYSYIDEAEVHEVNSILDLIDIPAVHASYKKVWIGMDFGWTQAPSAICVFGEVKVKGKTKGGLKLLARIVLKRVKPSDQLKVIMHLMETYRPVQFAMDATGAGQPVISLFSEKMKENPSDAWMADRVKSFGFSEKIVVGIDGEIEVKENDPNAFEKTAIRRHFLEASADAIRVLLDDGRMIFPYDKEFIGELQSAPKSNARGGISMDAYGKSTKRKSGQHSLDAMRMAVLAQAVKPIYDMMAQQEEVWEAPDMIIVDEGW